MPNKLSDAELQKIIPLIENTKWHYQLDQFSSASLKEINKSVLQARREVYGKLITDAPKMKDWEQARFNALAQELQNITVATRSQISGQIEQTAIEAGAKAYPKHAEIMSFGGRVASFNTVAMTAAQFKSVVNTPVGGKLLSEWVDTAFTANLKDTFKTEIAAGLLQGESYKDLVSRFNTKAFSGLENDIEGLTRTYVQSINVKAMDDTMRANADIVKGWKWQSVFENRSCIRCVSLSAQEEIYPIGGGPEMPLHVLCRCFKEIITKTFRELGVNIDEVKDAYRPYTIRGKIDPITGKVAPGKIGIGGGRKIETGRFLGDYNSFFKSLPANVQTQMLGPTRYGLWKSGKIKLADLADKNGNTRLLTELGVVRKGGKYVEKQIDKKVKKVVQLNISVLKKDGIKDALKSISHLPKSTQRAYIEGAINKASKTNVLIQTDQSGIVNAAASYKLTKQGADIDLLGSFGKGGGSKLIKAISLESQKAGTGGAIVLSPLGNASTITFYINKGFDDNPWNPARFYLSPEMAKTMGYVK